MVLQRVGRVLVPQEPEAHAVAALLARHLAGALVLDVRTHAPLPEEGAAPPHVHLFDGVHGIALVAEDDEIARESQHFPSMMRLCFVSNGIVRLWGRSPKVVPNNP